MHMNRPPISPTYESASDKSNTFGLFLLESLSLIYLNTGRLERARQTGQLQVQGAIRSMLPLMQYWGVWFLGMVDYHQNQLESAAQHFTQIFEHRYVAQISPYRDAVAGLALLHQMHGESAEAWKMVESISQFDLEQSGSEDQRTHSLRARLMLMQGDLEGAGKWVDAFTDPPPDMALLWLEEPQITRARILLARGADADLQSAQQVLDTLEEITKRTHNMRHGLEVEVLRALLLDARGEPGAADTVLKQALELAQPGGFIRVFVDQGKSMRAMLRRFEKQGHSVEAVGRILAAFPGGDERLASNTGPATPGRQPSVVGLALAEPLTPRELEVLTLLRGPSSIKEIALQLHISYATAKRHTINIYGKLGANQRWKAVDRAEELDILPPR
jgi:LuxR family transcriptional regulator, maltose regulon positive regulatory protein